MKVKELMELLSGQDLDTLVEWHFTHGKANTPVITGETYHTTRDALVIKGIDKVIIAVTENNVKGGYWV